jgi:hypothetical protein
MNAREKAEWHAIVPRETQPLLRTLRTVTVKLNDIHEAMTALGPGLPSDPVAWKCYRDLIKMRDGVATTCSVGDRDDLTRNHRAIELPSELRQKFEAYLARTGELHQTKTFQR